MNARVWLRFARFVRAKARRRPSMKIGLNELADLVLDFATLETKREPLEVEARERREAELDRKLAEIAFDG